MSPARGGANSFSTGSSRILPIVSASSFTVTGALAATFSRLPLTPGA